MTYGSIITVGKAARRHVPPSALSAPPVRAHIAGTGRVLRFPELHRRASSCALLAGSLVLLAAALGLCTDRAAVTLYRVCCVSPVPPANRFSGALPPEVLPVDAAVQAIASLQSARQGDRPCGKDVVDQHRDGARRAAALQPTPQRQVPATPVCGLSACQGEPTVACRQSFEGDRHAASSARWAPLPALHATPLDTR